MKVLHVLDHSVPLFSGYSFRSQSILEGQVALGFEPVVLTSPKHGSERDDVEEIGNIRYYRTGVLTEGPISGLPFVKESRLIKRLAARINEVVENEKVEVIHSHSPSLNGLASFRTASKLKLPFLYEARAFWEDAAVNHGTFKEESARYRISQWIETFLFKRAGAVVTICEGMRRDLVGRGVREEHVQVVPNGVDTEWFQPRVRAGNLIDKFGFEGKKIIGFVGSFYRYEGLRFLVDAVPRLAKSLPDAKVLLVGGGYDEALLREKAKRCSDSVIFAGQVPHAQIRDYYSIIDVFVCPRERIRLTDLVTPLKPLEAMSMRKAVLASDVGGHQELIEHDKTGLLFRADNQDDFLTQAARAIGDCSLRDAIGQRARRYVEEERSWPRIISRYVNIYEDLLRRR